MVLGMLACTGEPATVGVQQGLHTDGIIGLPALPLVIGSLGGRYVAGVLGGLWLVATTLPHG